MNQNKTGNVERLISKYERARNQWHVMYHKFEESDRQRELYFSKYKDTKKQLKDANKRIEELEEIVVFSIRILSHVYSILVSIPIHQR